MSAVRYDVAGGLATLTMDQPHNRNALAPPLINGLGDGLAAATADPSVRVVVLTNTGNTFCSGADLSGSPESEAPRYSLADIFTAMLDSPRPVVGRIAGHCMGGGVGLAAACDLSVVADSSRFGFTEVRIGAAPAIISVVCLPKLRRGDALELFLSGERITASRAASVGIVTKSVPDEDLDSAVSDLVAKLASGAPNALAAAKRLVFDIPGLERAAAFEQAAAISQALFAAEEAQEGMAAFREKRPPRWVP